MLSRHVDLEIRRCINSAADCESKIKRVLRSSEGRFASCTRFPFRIAMNRTIAEDFRAIEREKWSVLRNVRNLIICSAVAVYKCVLQCRGADTLRILTAVNR